MQDAQSTDERQADGSDFRGGGVFGLNPPPSTVGLPESAPGFPGGTTTSEEHWVPMIEEA